MDIVFELLKKRMYKIQQLQNFPVGITGRIKTGVKGT